MSTDQERRVAGKVVVITGAASGMGRAGAILLARHGAKVVATDRDVQGLSETLRLVREAGGDIVTTAGDVSSWDDNQRFVEVAKKEFGRLDAMWANAGIPQSFRPIGDVDPQELDRQFSVNARGPWLAAKSAIAELARTKGSLLMALLQTWGTAARRHPVGGLGSIGEMLIEHNHGFGQGRGSNSECSFNQAHLPHDTWLQAPCLGLSFA